MSNLAGISNRGENERSFTGCQAGTLRLAPRATFGLPCWYSACMSTSPPPEKVEAPRYVLPVVLLLVTLAFILLILDFYKAIVWAFVFALLSYPLYERLLDGIGRRGLAAGLTTVVVVLLVVLPAVGFGTILAGQASDVVQGIQDGEIDPAAPLRWMTDQVPRLSRWLESVGINVGDVESQLSGSIATGGEFVASQAVVLGQGALRTSLLLALTAYLLFFFLYDARRILHFVHQALPIQGPGERFLLQEVGSVTRATVKGIIIIGLVQGTLGGIVFAVLGISNAVLWGVAMAIATILPVVGTAIVWVPAAIVLFAAGSTVKGVLMIVAGVVLIGLADNLLRPRVVGRDTRMPDYIVLLATLGGLGAFGLTGLVLGPVIAGIFLASWRMFRPQVTFYEQADGDEAPGGESAA